MSLDSATRERIETLLKDHRVVLFMKGNRSQPMCGFSAAATNTLNELLPEYHTVNVLDDPEIREGIKAYGEWPTIPQLYVEGELVGGADIIRQMYGSGELHQLFGLAAPDRTPPDITITDAAAEAIRQGTANAPGMALHLEIGPDHSAGFQLAAAGEHDIVATANGLQIHFDPASAQRAKGIVIDWVSTVQGEGLSLKFPGAVEIKPLSVQQLQQRLAANDITLIDVRPAAGRAMAAPLAQARVLEEEGYESLAGLPKDTALAFICHHGMSSRDMAERFAAHGFSNLHNVEGGMDAWAGEIDPGVPRY
ncbi:Grx4 family monothiol glutaredoxin [Rhodanobacter denitrificans]|uniref:Monothiol glutaredoxin, Grx4 family n=1 Tax=Rhodanobacter denitrificans TaxID=666685 RepID=M4NLM5_9GAMM|nr:Grx4 family monothiol glutaredoxin [Rhodanobacter denitrificans]AGG90553.1 monothiol glutaredoxin, Grx4 family [Rhodanobacter denitrificans]UJJ50640.1 Grx4 family monothiol glutaredoxin [Rhodanobacter denitrificans]UJM85936.1 Grx4 family monothiol glutaredoxin [Rhodanobacter denitrificans]